MSLTFEQLPEAITGLCLKMENIERLLQQWNKPQPQQADDLLTLKQAASFLNLSPQTIYGLNSRNEIPAMKKGKLLYFSKQELTDWIKQGKKLTNTELQADTDSYLNSLNKKEGKWQKH